MAYVKFVKGTQAQYDNNASTYAGDGSVFFTTDNNLIYANGHMYGFSEADKALLKDSISAINILSEQVGDSTLKLEITYTDSTKTKTTVTLPAVSNTRNGLMTPSQKGDLEDVVEQVITGGAGTLKNIVGQNKVQSTDKSITVTDGSTSGNTITPTEISVNIDGTTIIRNSTTGVLSVASSALTQYVGDNKAIEVSAPDGNNNKTISLKIKSGDQILSAGTSNNAADGLAATIKIKSVTSSNPNVKAAYKLVGIGDTAINDSATIEVFKDSSLLSVALLHATISSKPTYANNTWTDIAVADQTEENLALCFAYQLANGNISVEAVPVGDFLRYTEFSKGVVWNANTGYVEGVVDGSSEDFLTVGTDGFKLDGVQSAINVAKAAAKTTINTTVSGESASHMTITKDSTAADGHDNYNFQLVDVASQDALEAEVIRAKSAETAIDLPIGLTKAQNAETRTYTNTGTYIGQAQNNTITSDIKALDTAIGNLNSDSVKGVVVNNRTASKSNDGTATVEIDAGDIKIDKDGTASAVINTGGSLTKGTTVEAAIVALEAQLLWYQAD